MGINSALGSSALLPAGLGFRNKIINGDMRINQRNTAITGNGYTLYTVDRWYVDHATGGARSIAINSDAPTGFSSSLRMTATTGASSGGSLPLFGQRIEAQNCSDLAYGSASAKQVTISFWVKSTVTGTYGVKIKAYSTYLVPYTVLVSNTWEYKTVTIPGDTSGVITDYIDVQFSIGGSSGFWGTSNAWVSSTSAYATSGQVDAMATTGNIFAITGVQMEQNYQPTPFEQRPIGVELALCQRYYFRYYGNSGGYSRFPSTGASFSGTSWQGVLNVPVTMRAVPSLVESSGVGCTDNVSFDSAAFTSVGVLTSQSHINGVFIQCSGGSGINNGQGHILIGRGGGSSYIALGAEL